MSGFEDAGVCTHAWEGVCLFVFGTSSLIPGSWYHAPRTWYQVPGTWYQVPWYQVPGASDQVPGTEHKQTPTQACAQTPAPSKPNMSQAEQMPEQEHHQKPNTFKSEESIRTRSESNTGQNTEHEQALSNAQTPFRHSPDAMGALVACF